MPGHSRCAPAPAARLKGWSPTAAGPPSVFLNPWPDPQSARAVHHRLVHGQVVQRRLLGGHDDVRLVPAAQAVIGQRLQGDHGVTAEAADFQFHVEHGLLSKFSSQAGSRPKRRLAHTQCGR